MWKSISYKVAVILGFLGSLEEACGAPVTLKDYSLNGRFITNFFFILVPPLVKSMDTAPGVYLDLYLINTSADLFWNNFNIFIN